MRYGPYEISEPPLGQGGMGVVYKARHTVLGTTACVKLLLPESANDPKVGYGGHMPNSNSSLPKAQLDAIRDWIARGAHRTEAATVSGSTCVVEDMGTPDGG